MGSRVKSELLTLLSKYQKLLRRIEDSDELILKSLDFLSNHLNLPFAFLSAQSEVLVQTTFTDGTQQKLNDPGFAKSIRSLKKTTRTKSYNKFIQPFKKKGFENNGISNVIPIKNDNSTIGAMLTYGVDKESMSLLEVLLFQLEEKYTTLLKFNRLKRIGAKYRSLMNSDSDYIMVLGPDYKVLDVNKTVEEYTKNEVIGSSLIELNTSEEERLRTEKHLKKAFKGEETNYESTVELGGKVYHYQSTILPCVDDDGAVFAAILMSKDVTKEVIAKNSLVKSEERYRQLVEGSKSAIFRIDNKGKVIYANQFAIDFFGFERKELIGKHVLETFVPRVDTNGNDLTLMVKKAFDDPLSLKTNENENIKKDGTRVWMSWTNKPSFDEEGNFIEVLSIGNDITALKENEANLIQQTQIIDQINDSLICTDLSGKIFYVNNGTERITGFTKKELIGKQAPFFNQKNKNYDFNPYMILSALMQTGSHVITTVGHTKEGKSFDLELSFSLLKDADEKPYGLLSYGKDITKKVKDKAYINRLASIVQTSSDLIGISDLEGNILFVNESGKSLLSIDDYTETQIFEYFPDKELEKLEKEILPKVISDGRWYGESIFKNIRTNEDIAVLLDVFRIDDPITGEPLNFATISRDIRDLNKQQNQLIESELALKEAQHIGKMGSWEVDIKENRLSWSDEVYRIFEFEVGEIPISLEVFLDMVHKDDMDNVRKAFEKHVNHDETYDLVHRIYTKSGKVKYVRERGITIRNEKNEPIKTVGTVADINDQKLIEIELEKYKNNLEDLVKQRTEQLEKANESLYFSEEKFRGLVEGTSLGVGMSDGPKIFYANRALLNIFGYDNPEEFYQKTIFEHCTTKGKEALSKRYNKLKAGKNVSETYRCEFKRKDQTTIICQVASNDIHIGNRKYRQATFVDITELLKTREKLRQSEELYRTLTETIRDVISVFDAQYNCIFISKGVQEILGYTEDEVKQLDLSKLVHPKDLQDECEILQSAIKARKGSVIHQSRILSKHGEYISIEHATKLKYNKNNKFEQFVTSSRDITNRLKTEKKLRRLNKGLKKSNEEYRKVATELSNRINEVNHKNELIKEQNALLSNSEYELKALNTQLKVRNNAINQIAIVSVTDHKGKIIEVNQRFCEISKYSSDEIKGKTLKILNSGYHDQKVFNDMWQTITSGQVWRGEIRNKAKDGSIFWLLKTIVPFYPGDGTNIFYFSLSSDITEQKEREMELAEAKLRAEQAMQVKEEFLSVMSHEIRTPLNSVIGLSELLMKRNPKDDQKEVLKTLNFSADNLMRLINDILDFSKIEARKLNIERQKFNLYELLADIKEAHQLAAKEKGIELSLFTTSNLPEYILCDPLRLKQILNNLISNAIKFTYEGEVSIEAELIRVKEIELYLRFKVIDTGIGVPEEDKEIIFEAFEQSRKQEVKNQGGTGLGLAIVKNLVSLFGGEIYVESRTNVGSNFTVEIPCRLASTQKRVHSIDVSTSENLKVEGKKVLYVEDVKTNQFLIQQFLKGHSIECSVVDSGEEAVKLIKNQKFDLILMDIQMDGMDGYETARIMRKYNEHYKNIPIIAFTADTSEHTALEIKKAGMNDVLTKPLNSTKLVALLNKYLQAMQLKKIVDFNLDYFSRAFGSDQKKLSNIYRILINDITSFYTEFMNFYDEGDYEGIRQEIHKIEPILSHLKHQKLLNLLSKYKSFEKVDGNMNALNQELALLIDQMKEQLKALST